MHAALPLHDPLSRPASPIRIAWPGASLGYALWQSPSILAPFLAFLSHRYFKPLGLGVRDRDRGRLGLGLRLRLALAFGVGVGVGV
eukprot:4571626-Pleurochrysis_carterae.AAC.4